VQYACNAIGGMQIQRSLLKSGLTCQASFELSSQIGQSFPNTSVYFPPSFGQFLGEIKLMVYG